MDLYKYHKTIVITYACRPQYVHIISSTDDRYGTFAHSRCDHHHRRRRISYILINCLIEHKIEHCYTYPRLNFFIIYLWQHQQQDAIARSLQ